MKQTEAKLYYFDVSESNTGVFSDDMETFMKDGWQIFAVNSYGTNILVVTLVR